MKKTKTLKWKKKETNETKESIKTNKQNFYPNTLFTLDKKKQIKKNWKKRNQHLCVVFKSRL